MLNASEEEKRDRERFQSIVSGIVELFDEEDELLEEKVAELEKEIEQTGYGEAYFFATKGDVSEIDFDECFRYKYYASYYDGMQAPFIVCGWNGSVDFLLKLVTKHGLIKGLHATPTIPIKFDAFNPDPLTSIGGKQKAGGRSFSPSDFKDDKRIRKDVKMEKASMVTDKGKLVIVNNFDIEDIKKNVEELLSYSILIPKNQIDYALCRELNVLCIGAAICAILAAIPGLFTCSIASWLACFCALLGIWGIFFFAIFRYYLDEQASKPFRRKAESMLKEAQTLKDIEQTVDAIYEAFRDYSFSKAPTNISFSDLQALRRNLNNYFDIRDIEILSASLNGKTLYIDLQGNDRFVEKMEITVEPKEQVGAAGPSILFKNWCTPTYVRRYSR